MYKTCTRAQYLKNNTRIKFFIKVNKVLHKIYTLLYTEQRS